MYEYHISGTHFPYSEPAFYYWFPAIYYIEDGCDPAWRGGYVTRTGWYVDPFCHPGCCRPAGPFPTYNDALRWSRIEHTDLNEEIPFVPVGHA